MKATQLTLENAWFPQLSSHAMQVRSLINIWLVSGYVQKLFGLYFFEPEESWQRR